MGQEHRPELRPEDQRVGMILQLLFLDRFDYEAPPLASVADALGVIPRRLRKIGLTLNSRNRVFVFSRPRFRRWAVRTEPSVAELFEQAELASDVAVALGRL